LKEYKVMKRIALISTIILLGFSAVAGAQKRADIVLEDFEGKDYGRWTTTGTAFGTGPAQGPLPGQMAVMGFHGHGLVNSFHGGDAGIGTLTSPEFKIERKFIAFLIGGGMHPGSTCINLVVEGKPARSATGPNDRSGGTERLDWKAWDVRDMEGQMARIEIVDRETGGWGHINVDDIMQTDESPVEEIKTSPLYAETYRPQFHFTASKNWLNDPNGLVFYKGDYHLFFQHNPLGVEWGNMTWGHAVSSDLVHWTQLENALMPDARGTMFSGSAVVDWHNTSGFKSADSKSPPLIALYTAAGGTSPESKGQPFTQCLAYSNDAGHTWTKYASNPVLNHIAGENRDPKVVWYAPTKSWITALYLDKSEFAFFSSPNLKDWTLLQKMDVPGVSECPDFFPIRVSGKPGPEKWVWTAANGHYLVGTFDGHKFTPETDLRQVDFGGNYYAVQSYSDIPAADGRRIQIAWMAGGSYPQMPFNQQMSFPCTLTLHRTPDGLRLFREPVAEISRLHEKAPTWHDLTVSSGENPLHDLKGELWDIQAEFEPGTATQVGLTVRGEAIVYDVQKKTLTCLGHTAPLELEDGKLKLRILADRTSLEVFGNSGRVSLTSCFLPRPKEQELGLHIVGGKAKLLRITAIPLRSAWATPSAHTK
jgi:fructan beta-fructosidase